MDFIHINGNDYGVIYLPLEIRGVSSPWGRNSRHPTSSGAPRETWKFSRQLCFCVPEDGCYSSSSSSSSSVASPTPAAPGSGHRLEQHKSPETERTQKPADQHQLQRGRSLSLPIHWLPESSHPKLGRSLAEWSPPGERTRFSEHFPGGGAARQHTLIARVLLSAASLAAIWIQPDRSQPQEKPQESPKPGLWPPSRETNSSEPSQAAGWWTCMNILLQMLILSQLTEQIQIHVNKGKLGVCVFCLGDLMRLGRKSERMCRRRQREGRTKGNGSV